MSRVWIPVLDDEGREAEIELTVRRDTVGCSSGGLSRAVFDRDAFRVWLGSPAGMIESDEVTFGRLPHGSGVTVHGQVPMRAVPEHVFHAVRERI